MNKSNVYYMEKDGAVKIPDKYKTMSHEEISDECARLVKTIKDKAKITDRKTKSSTKTKFIAF